MFPDVGSTWIATIKGKLWPVVLCGEEVAPPLFTSLRIDPEHMPAIQLGRHRYVFVDNKMLTEYDPHKNYLSGLGAFPEKDIQTSDSRDVIEEKQRRVAFRQDALQYKDHHFWANYIATQSHVRRLERERQRPSTTPRQPRSTLGEREAIDRGNAPDYSQGYVPAMKRRKIGSLKKSQQLPTPTKTPWKSQYQKHPIPEAIEISDSESEGVDDDLHEHTAHFGTIPASGEGSRRARPSIEGSDGLAKKAISTASRTAPGPDECALVFAHGERKRLLIRKEVLAKCSYLNHRKADDDGATELNLTQDERANDVELTGSDIAAVLGYYQEGDIGPRFITNTVDGRPLLSRLDSLPNRHLGHIETLGKAFVSAVKLGDEDLRSLVYQKLRALAPTSAVAIFVLAKCTTNLAALAVSEDEIAIWVTDLVKRHYWLLAKQSTDLLQSILEQNGAMRIAVYDYLKDNPKGGMEGYDESEI